MKPDLLITSASNPRLKQATALRDRRDRETSGLFLIEGYREANRAIIGKVVFDHLFFCPELFLGTNEEALLSSAKAAGTYLIQTPPHLFQKLSYRDRPDGILAVAKKMDYRLKDILLTKNPLIVIAEAIEKPGNLGTIIRSSDAAGVNAVIVANGCTDIYNPNVVRASVGTLFTIPVIETSNEEALAFCQQNGLTLLAATPEGQSVYTQVPMTGPLGIVVGTEQLGLSSFWKSSCHLHVKIPMHGVADSLNVATATTLFLFEAARQRYGS